MNNKLKLLAAVAALATSHVALADPISGQGTWETTLQARDFDGDQVTDAYYDTALNITWLATANAGTTLNWADANSWAANLVVGGVTDWRLPSTIDVGNDGCSYMPGGGGADCGFQPNAASSELAHMYYVTLGNTGSPNDQGSPNDSSWGLHNTGSFLDMRQNVYWSNTIYGPDPTAAWGFSNYFGYQAPYEAGYGARAWAVADGDVMAAVPEPSTYALMLVGLAAVGLVGRRRPGRQQAR
jgi:hypothetical protein